MNILICDDDINELNKISTFVQTYIKTARQNPTITTFTVAQDLIDYTRGNENAFDLILLDVEMPEMNGFDAAREIGNTAKIIFITYQNEHIFNAFRIRPYGFVRKSHIEDELSYWLDKFFKIPPQKELRFSTDRQPFYILSTDIVYVKANKNHLDIHLVDREISVAYVMSRLETDLADFGFIRTHNKYLVNAFFIDEILEGEVKLTVDAPEPILLSRRNRKKALEGYALYVGNE